ncbi:MAG: flagellar motor switch protein FliN [Oscillospiraceae bacterium]|nr:flagellar motor switch protein FliN [Oscillospiraceae bacterium]MBQ5337203.1 flagellar motor switch protein FliN [Oscillospiraceae bacterium]
MKTKSINVKEATFPDFSAGDSSKAAKSEDYTPLLMNVPLDVRVEIGRAKLRMREVLNLGQGSIIRLEKQAGAPVDVIANNQTVARGDVIVIDDNFGVRITEIISNRRFMTDAEKAAEEKAAREKKERPEPEPKPAPFENLDDRPENTAEEPAEDTEGTEEEETE